MNDLSDFNKSAMSLAQSPLGIIALFIVLVYGLASLVLTLGSSLDADERRLITYFLVTFPVFVLSIFTYLVVWHYSKLFGPSNFKNEDNFIRMQLSAAALLTAAASKDNEAPTRFQIEQIVNTVGSTTRTSMRLEQKGYILWVDDRPENNIYERSAFDAVGLKFALALSTNEALEQISLRKFEVVISDMGRKEGPREGYVLLDKLRKEGNNIPLFFYASSNSPQHKKETASRGGQGCTNNGQELFEIVLRTIMESRQ